MCLPATERAAARQRAAATAAGFQLIEKLPTPNKDRRIPVGVYQTIRDAVHDEAKLQSLCEYWAGNPVIDWYVSHSDDSDSNALHLACELGRVDAARLLISAGADVNFVCDGKTPLISACLRNPDLPTIRLLINEGSDVNAAYMTLTRPLDLIMKRIDAYSRTGYKGEGVPYEPVPAPADLLAIAELLKRAGGTSGDGGCLWICWTLFSPC
jgi:hypothetical protein